MSDMPTTHNRFVPSRGCTRGVILYASVSTQLRETPTDGYKIYVRAVGEEATAEAEVRLQDLERALADLRRDVESEEDAKERESRDLLREEARNLADVLAKDIEEERGDDRPYLNLDRVGRLVGLVRTLLKEDPNS